VAATRRCVTPTRPAAWWPRTDRAHCVVVPMRPVWWDRTVIVQNGRSHRPSRAQPKKRG